MKERRTMADVGADFRMFDLDKNRLDDEWVVQPKRFLKAATELSDAKEEADRLKAERDLLEAELDNDIRSRPEDYGLAKLTEPAIKKTIMKEERMARMEDKIIKARHKVGVLDALVSALEHRKKALENLVQLRLAEYFSEPREPQNSERIKSRVAFNRRNKR